VLLLFLRCFCLPRASPTEFSPLSLHDALPISVEHHTEGPPPRWPFALGLGGAVPRGVRDRTRAEGAEARGWGRRPAPSGLQAARSEEHTSELQSRENLVCRLLLEKKKYRNART